MAFWPEQARCPGIGPKDQATVLLSPIRKAQIRIPFMMRTGMSEITTTKKARQWDS